MFFIGTCYIIPFESDLIRQIDRYTLIQWSHVRSFQDCIIGIFTQNSNELQLLDKTRNGFIDIMRQNHVSDLNDRHYTQMRREWCVVGLISRSLDFVGVITSANVIGTYCLYTSTSGIKKAKWNKKSINVSSEIWLRFLKKQIRSGQRTPKTIHGHALLLNTLRPRQNDRHSTGIFKSMFLNRDINFINID